MLNSLSFPYTNWNNTRQINLSKYHSSNKKKTWRDLKNWLVLHQQYKYASYFKIKIMSQIRCQTSDTTNFCDVLVKQQRTTRKVRHVWMCEPATSAGPIPGSGEVCDDPKSERLRRKRGQMPPVGPFVLSKYRGMER